MLEVFFFVLGLVNSVFLIFIFMIQKNRLALLQRIGWLYLVLAIPAAYGIFLVVHEQKAVRYGIFLGIFLAFLLLEWLYDHVFKISFRENWKRNWKWLVLSCINLHTYVLGDQGVLLSWSIRRVLHVHYVPG